MPTNDFLEFCSTDTGSNLLSEADYLASSDRVSGNKPGVASARLNNRALRQANFLTSNLAQLTANQTGADVLDDAVPARMLAQLSALAVRIAPVVTKYTSGSGTHNKSYVFFIASGNATAAATYTNNTFTFTVGATIAAGTQLLCSGTGAPAVSGTLTKASGAGDATLTFYAVRAPLFFRVKMVGGGGGGGGGGNSGLVAAGGNGGNTTFGTTLLVANGGNGGTVVGAASVAGGTASLGTGPFGLALQGGSSNLSYGTGGNSPGSIGTSSPFGGSGAPGITGNNNGGNAIANTGSGGGGGGGATASGGGGGAAGGYVDAVINSPDATYAYAVGAAGISGPGNTGNGNGGAGGSGVIDVEEHFQ